MLFHENHTATLHSGIQASWTSAVYGASAILDCKSTKNFGKKNALGQKTSYFHLISFKYSQNDEPEWRLFLCVNVTK